MEDKYKQYEKRKQEHEHKKRAQWLQPELPFHGTTKEEYYRHISNNAPQQLTEQEVNDLFWDTLINLGWRLNTHSNGERRIVFACPKCEMIIDDQPYKGLQSKDALSMRNKRALDGMLLTHNGERCIPVGEEE